MQTLQLDRRTCESIVLSVLSLIAVASLRFHVESRVLFIAEMFLIAAFFVAAVVVTSRHRRLLIAIAVTPIVAALVARVIGSPIAFEMTALTTLGTASLAMAIGSERTQPMSLVSSGFLTLFAVAISDNQHAVLIAIAWLAVCVWHLIANHWERLDLCAVQQVHRGKTVRPASVVAAVAICVLSGLVVRDRFGESKRFNAGFMPTSGGSKWSDPAARSGVGTGDAAIAAKDHTESFGAVESELFLESTQPSLFDMYNDTIGEPKKKMKWERRQGLAPQKVIETHEQTAKSEKGGSSFSTDRMPPKKHLHLKDSPENAVIQWAGPTGIRLAMNRYDTFDGSDWTNSATLRNEKLDRREYDGAAWFMDPKLTSPTSTAPEVTLLKVLRLDSTRLPVPMMTKGVHVKDVDRQDFFGIEDDGSYFMPGRDKVPALTVVNVASTQIREDELWDRLPLHRPSVRFERNEDAASMKLGEPSPTAVASDPPANGRVKLRLDSHTLADCATQWTAGCDHPYEKLQAIVSHLRTYFTFDRSAETKADDPIADFLKTRRGGDHVFATTAALLAREIGLQSRLVTGFYVRPSAVDITAGHTNVLPDDVHVWVEIQLDDDLWFEIEPTPGYRQPIYTPSAWLVTQQFAAAHWPHAIGLVAVAGLLFVTRLFWIELGLSVLYLIGVIVWPRGRMALAMRVLQTRAKYAGCSRIAGRPQRDWLLSITSTHEPLLKTARRFCDAADRAAFAESANTFHENNVSNELLMNLKIPVLRQLSTESSV